MKTIVLVLLALLPLVAAQETNLSYHIVGGRTVVNGIIQFQQAFSGDISLTIPLDAVALSVYADDQIQPMRLEEQTLSLFLNRTNTLRWSYTSRSFLGHDSFVANIVLPVPGNALIRLTLPEKSVLTKPVNSGSVFPKPTTLLTDGQAITILWRKNNVRQNEEFPAYVTYEIGQGSWLLLLGIGILGLFALGIVSYYVHRAIWRKHHPHLPKPAKSIETHLKEDEQQVIQILKQREGQAEQGTLRVITGFSKAKLSSLLSELEERKVIFREKRGKKNLVFLKEL